MSHLQLSVYQPAPSASSFADLHKRNRRAHLIAAVLLTLLLGAVYVIANGNFAAPLVLIVFAGVVVLLWNSPAMLLPITVAGACLFETMLYNFQDSLTDRVPLFWDLNTIFQIYGHADVHVIPFSPFEIILILGSVFALIRGVYNRTLVWKGGAFVGPIIAYLVCVAYGIANGMATGGDYHIALFEVRAQFYILFAYLIAINSGREPRELFRITTWTAALCIGLKGVLLSFRYFVTLGRHTNPDLGVGAHEESFFFNEFVVLYVVMKMADMDPSLRRWMLYLMPFVVIANLANERRAATAALGIAVPVVLALCFAAFPQRRKLIGGLFAGITVFALFYIPAFWNSDGVIAQPARAIRSHFDPTARDESSDIYRQQEDANLMYTMRSSPIIGFGYGKPIYNISGMVNLSDTDPLIMYLTHDQILWVWMRLGAVGFVVFWIMIANFLIRAANVAADTTFEQSGRAAAVFVGTTISMLLIFGLYDLQLSNVRDMLFSSACVGVLGSVLRQRAEQEEAAKLRRQVAMQRYLHPCALSAPSYSYMPGRIRQVNASTDIVRSRQAAR